MTDKEKQTKEESKEVKEEKTKAEKPEDVGKEFEDEKKKKEEEEKVEELHIKASADIFKTVVGTISPFTTEASFKFDEKGFKTVVVDNAHVGMADIDIKKEAFEEYHSTGINIGVDIEKMTSILKLVGSSDVLSLDYSNKDNENRIILSFGNLVRKMGMIDLEGIADPKVPNITSIANITIDANKIKLAIKAAEQLSDHLQMKATKELFEFYAEGDTDTFTLDYKKEELPELIVREAKASSLFALDYLNDCLKSTKNDTQVKIGLGTDAPVSMVFDIVEGKGTIKTLIAPRIETE